MTKSSESRNMKGGGVVLSDAASYRIRLLSFVCALLIVPIHASYLGQNVEMSALTRGIMTVLSDGICRVAVPFFFTISGFFLAAKFTPTFGWYRGILMKRFRTLYIPFVLWNIIYFGLQLVNGKGFGGAAERLFGYNLWGYPACMQFWYLQTLFFVFLVSPILLALLKCRWTAPLLLLAFLVGGVFNNYGLYLPQQLQLIDFFFVSLGCVLAFGWHLLPSSHSHQAPGTKHQALFSLSFFIYASHFIAINLVGISLRWVHLPILAAYLIKIVAGIAFGVIGGYLLRRYLPRVYGILTGGR